MIDHTVSTVRVSPNFQKSRERYFPMYKSCYVICKRGGPEPFSLSSSTMLSFGWKRKRLIRQIQKDRFWVRRLRTAFAVSSPSYCPRRTLGINGQGIISKIIFLSQFLTMVSFDHCGDINAEWGFLCQWVFPD